MIKSLTKCFGSADSRGPPMESYSPILTVHPAPKLLLFFYSRSSHWKFAGSLHQCVREAISILNSPQMVKHWRSPEIRRECSRSTQSRSPEERNNVLPQIPRRNRGLR